MKRNTLFSKWFLQASLAAITLVIAASPASAYTARGYVYGSGVDATNPVAGARVEVFDFSNGTTVTGTTDSTGLYNFNAGGPSTPPQNDRITIFKDGLRFPPSRALGAFVNEVNQFANRHETEHRATPVYTIIDLETNGPLPEAVALYGMSGYEAGTVRLSTNAINGPGSLVIEDLDRGLPVNRIDVSFVVRAPQNFGSQSNGYSISWGADIPDAPFGEQGAGTNLVVSMRYDRFGDTFIEPRIVIFWQGNVLTNHVVDDYQDFGGINDQNLFAFRRARVTVDETGLVTVRFGERTDFADPTAKTSARIPGFTGLAGARLGIGSHNGLGCSIDDLFYMTTRLQREIGGRVTRAGVPEAGVTVNQYSNGVLMATTVTDSNGIYRILEDVTAFGITNRIEFAKAGLTFNPPMIEDTADGDLLDRDARVVLYSGRVVSQTFTSLGLSGVTISLTNATNSAVSASVVTDSNGYFNVTGMPAGPYNIRPDLVGLSFADRFGAPAPVTVALGVDNDETTNALWRVTSPFVAGYVNAGGVPQSGVTVGAGSTSAVTDASGFFILAVSSFPVTVTPSQAGYTFFPAGIVLNVSTQAYLSFERNLRIGGRVLNAPASIATNVALAALPDGRTFTNAFLADGSFTFDVPQPPGNQPVTITLPSTVAGGAVVPSSFLAPASTTNLVAQRFSPPANASFTRAPRTDPSYNANWFRAFPALPIQLSAAREPMTSVFGVNGGVTGTNGWLGDRGLQTALLAQVSFANRAAVSATFTSVTTKPFGLFATNWPVTMTHGTSSVYTFHLTSDDAAALYLDGDLLLSTDAEREAPATYDFNSGLPSGVELFGSAFISNGVLELNPFLGGQSGAARISGVAPGRPANGFTARFTARVDYSGGPGPADGFSFTWATNLPAGTYGEDGAGDGLVVSFDTFNNGPGGEAGIRVRWQGTTLATIPGSFIARATNAFVDVMVRVRAGGRLDVTYDRVGYVTDLVLPGFAPVTDGQFGFGSRTGGSFETHGIDDLSLELLLDSASGAATRSVSFSLPGTGNVSHVLSLQYLDLGGTASLGVDWSLAGPGGFSQQPVPGPVDVTFTRLPTVFTSALLADGQNQACQTNPSAIFNETYLGDVLFQPEAAGANFTPAGRMVSPGGSGTFEARGGYAGRVVDPDGLPLPGVTVRVISTYDGSVYQCSLFGDQFRVEPDGFNLVTDANGEFSVDPALFFGGPMHFVPIRDGTAFNPPYLTVSENLSSIVFTSRVSVVRFGPIPPQSVNEDGSIVIPFTVSDFFSPASGITVQATSGNQGIVPNTGLVLGGSDSNRTLTITPAFNAFTVAPIEITLTANNQGVPGQAFFVRTIFDIGVVGSASFINSFLMPYQASLLSNVFSTADVLNFTNAISAAAAAPGATGFPGLTGPTDRFAVEAIGVVHIPTSGEWTFVVRSDDGFICTIGNNSFTFDGIRGVGDSFATYNLAAGAYPVRILYYENDGSALLEFQAAPGAHTNMNSSFRFVGDTANGGLFVGGSPSVKTFNLTVNPVNDPPTAGPYTGMAFSNGNIRAAGAGGLMTGGELTIEFWQKIGAIQSHETVGVYPGQGNKFIRTYVPYTDNRVYFDYGDWTGPGRLSYELPTDIVGTWQHFAFVVSASANGGAGVMRIYRNGELEAERNSVDNTFAPNLADFFIGGNTYQGTLAEMRVWNIARTEREIQVNKDLPLRGDEAGLLLYYRFLEGYGPVVSDSATGVGGTNSAVRSDSTSTTWLPNGDGYVRTLPVDEDSTTDLYLPAFDYDHPVLNFGISSAPSHGDLTQLGGYGGALWRYSPDTNYYGLDQFTYTVTDASGGSTSSVVFLNVINVNDPPTISVIPNQTITESQNSQPIPFTVGDDDGFPELLIISATSSDPVLARAEDILFVTNTPTSRALIIRPQPEQIGTVTITLTLSDGIDQITASFDVRIDPRPAFSLVDVGQPAGRPITFGAAINDRGAVAGFGTVNNLGQQARAFLNQGIDNDLFLTELSTLGGATASALGVNNNNDVVGVSLDGSGASRAFRTDGITIENLGTLTGGNFSQATAINDVGDIVGFATVSGARNRAFLWRPGAGMSDLGVLPGFTDSSQAFAINVDGDIVGVSYAANGHARAFYRNAVAGTLQDLGTLGGSFSIARGINEFDAVVGRSTLGDGSSRAFLWNGSAMTSLGTLPGGGNSEAFAINTFGQVVGSAFSSNGVQRAFLFTQGQMFDLNDVIPEEQLANWTLTSATAINGRGEIVGTGVRNGQTRAFLLVPAAVIGRQVSRPPGTVAARPEIELLNFQPGDSPENAFFYSEAAGEDKLYATRPVTARIRWRITENQLDTNRVNAVTVNVWPRVPQIHVTEQPVEIEPSVPGFAHRYIEMRYTTSSDAKVDPNTKVFTATNSGYTVLMYLRNNGASPDPQTQPPYFEVARTLPVYDARHFLDNQPAIIGDSLTSPFHRDYPGRNGRLFFPYAFIDSVGPDAAYNRDARTGPILPVNKRTASRVGYADPLVVVWYATNRIGVAWAHKAVRYEPDWSTNAPTIVIASGQGAGFLPPNLFQEVRLYNQPNARLAGFNPNEEHALILPGPSGDTAYALRNDLNTVSDFSDPYVMLKFRDPTANNEWRILPHRVLIEDATHQFVYGGDVGKEIQPPFPLSVFNLCFGSEVVSGPGWRDRNNKLYAVAAGPGINDPVNIVARYDYPMQPGFLYDLNADGTNDVGIGQCVPWLDRRPGGVTGESVDVTYSIRWPTNAPVLQIGETLLRSRRGLPGIYDFFSAELVYDSTNPDGTNFVGSQMRLFDPVSSRGLWLNSLSNLSVAGSSYQLPSGIARTQLGGVETFDRLNPDLADRVSYDPINRILRFTGQFDESVLGQPLLMLNVMTSSERDTIKDLFPGSGVAKTDWDKVVDALYDLTRNPNRVDLDNNGQPDPAYRVGLATQYTIRSNGIESATFVRPVSPAVTILATNVVPESLQGGPKALYAGGYDPGPDPWFVTIAENNDPISEDPVALHVIRVAGGPFPGDLKFLTPGNLFSEQLTIRHSADFAGEPERLEFEWYYAPDSATFNPTNLPLVDASGNVIDPRGWLFYSDATGPGANSLTLGGEGSSSLLVLGDNWFVGRYRGYNISNEVKWTGWIGDPSGTPSSPRAALAEGWIKRVVRGVNPFDQRFSDFHKNEVNTFASMLIQAGERFEGAIAMNDDAAQNAGLIEAYTTLFNRGRDLSIEGIPPVNFDPANNALLFAASRISDLYVLLGNEAFADSTDPTIGFGIGSGEYGSASTAIHAFQNQTGNLLEEELALLRGRDTTGAGVTAPPIYNRLFWNFTLGEGELAYQQAFNIGDFDLDGFITEADARIQYPQGHGDAWGHYLTASKIYYELMRHPYFTWVPRAESVNVLGVAVSVDYFDERKFAKVASAKAKTGSEIVALTYRQKFIDDTTGQWQGYKDTDTDRAWGVTEWARRAGQGVFFDWVAANALLYATDPNTNHVGIQKIDRTTVLELREIPAQLNEIQKHLDMADIGLNPVGVAKGAVPFDIDPSAFSSPIPSERKSHFEQIADRAIKAMNNALTTWDEANKFTSLLRRNQDDVDQFVPGVVDEETNYRNRLIEIFGYPYAGDIGAGRTYPSGYVGPDLYHWMYVDTAAVTGESMPPSENFTGFFRPVQKGGNGAYTFFLAAQQNSFLDTYDTTTFETSELNVDFPIVPEGASRYAFQAPASWGSRRAPGKIQEAISDMIQEEAKLKFDLQNYDGLIRDIEDQVELLEAQYRVNANEIRILDKQRATITGMNAAIGSLRATQLVLGKVIRVIGNATEAAGKAIPKIAGLAFDIGSPIEGGIKAGAAGAVAALDATSTGLEIAENSIDLAKERVGLTTEIELTVNSQNFEVLQRVKEIQHMMREEVTQRIGIFTQREVLMQTIGRYRAALAEGQRLHDELAVFRQRSSAEVSEQRYEDMTFRLFRNEALQKYRASFDLAARYVYLAANAYDYEVNFLGDDTRSGREFLTDIVRQRTLGQMINGQPVVGLGGLADPMSRMLANWQVLKSRYGINNPLVADSRFSLRRELMRVGTGPDRDEAWRELLMQSRVDNLWDVPEFRRFCRPFAPESAGPQPGFVIRFPSTVTFGLNFFGWPLSGGDSTYDPTRFATKINRAGVWFSGSDGTQLSATPNVYLVPAGMDILRSPAGNTLATREWRIVDQVIPEPFPIGQNALNNPNWIPAFDSVGGTFAEIRRFSSFPAYHDQGIYAEAQTTIDTRLVGRSVWNTDWMLIIPGGTLLNDPDEGLDTFINIVRDIKIYFQTYSYSGN